MRVRAVGTRVGSLFLSTDTIAEFEDRVRRFRVVMMGPLVKPTVGVIFSDAIGAVVGRVQIDPDDYAFAAFVGVSGTFKF